MNYQIKTIEGVLWIIPNTAPYPLTTDISIRVAYINGPKLSADNPQHDINGTIKLQWEPAAEPVTALITIPAGIIMDADRSKLKDAWKQFVAALDEQADEAFQYMAPQGPAVVLAQLLQNIPLPQQEVKYYQLHLGFDDRPYIDLQAGMRLKLTFANYYNEAHSGSGQQLKGFAGTGTSYAYVQSGIDGSYLSFNPYMDLQQVTVTAADNLIEKDIKLVANVVDLVAANKHRHYRLLYPTGEFIASDKPGLDLQKSVCLAGASSYSSLPDLSTPLGPNAPNYHLSLFNGRSVVVPEILIRLNGVAIYVAAGSVLKNLLEKESLTGISPNKLTFLRYYNGVKSKLTFENATVATELYLLPGDDITWVPTANFALNERVKAIYRISDSAIPAFDLGRLTLTSYGGDSDVALPAANDMGVALVSLNNQLYDVLQIAAALYRNYNNQGYFINAYAGEELAYSLYFAGFDVIAVSKGLVAEVLPVIEVATGDRLVYFLLQSGIGYNVRDIGNGIYKTLYKNERQSAWYMVKALIMGAVTYKQPYDPRKIAEGVYYAIGYQVDGAAEFASALMIGSHGANPDRYYNVGDIAHLLYLTYQSDGEILTEVQLAHALANACKGQPLGYSVSQVAEGVATVYFGTTAERMALTLKDCGGGYGIADVAVGTYSVKYNKSTDKVSAQVLTAALYKAYNGKPDAPAQLNVEIAKAVSIAIQGIENLVLARALADVFGYKADNEQQLIDLIEALDAVYRFDANNKDVLVHLAADLKGAVTFNNKDRKHGQHFSKALKSLKNGQVEIVNNAWAVLEALAYNGDDQGDVTFLIGSLFYAYQADAYTLASTTVVACWYVNSRRDQMLHLATGLRDALGYSKDSIEQAELVARVLISALPGISGVDVMWTIGEVFDCNTTTPDHAHVNFLARITKVVYNISKDDKVRVNELAANLTEIFKLDKEGEQGKASIGLIANALVFAFTYRGDDEADVAMVATAILAPFDKLGLEVIGRTLFTIFRYSTSAQHQSELNYLAKALAKACNYNGKDVNQVTNIVNVLVNVFALIIDGRYDQQVVDATARAVKYAFDYQKDDAQAAYYAITVFIKVFPSIDNVTVFKAVVPVFEISISKQDQDIYNEPNQSRFNYLLNSIRDARDIQITNDGAIINLLQFAADYFDLNDYSVGALALLAKSLKSVLKLVGLTQDIANRCTKLVATSYGFLYPEPWLYHDLGQLGKAIKIAFADEYPYEIVKAFQYALPGLLPSQMGRALVSILDFDQSADSLDAVATAIFANYDYKAMGYFQILAFGLLLDQCNWGADKYQDKVDWCKKAFDNWKAGDEQFIRFASTDEILKASSLLLLQDSSPQQMAQEIKAQFATINEIILLVFTGVSIYSDYFLLQPQDGTRPMATALKESGYRREYCFFVLKGLYENRWKDEYDAIVDQVYNQTVFSQDSATQVAKIEKDFKEIIEDAVFRGGK